MSTDTRNNSPTTTPQARLGLDTCVLRIALQRAPGDLSKAPKIQGFSITDERTRFPRPDFETKAWTLFNPALEIWINGFDLQHAAGFTTGKLEISFSFAFIQDCLARPNALIHCNQGIVSPQRACDIFWSLLTAIGDGLGLLTSDFKEVEIIRLDCFCDFVTVNRKEVIEAFRDHKPKVSKTPAKNSREFDDVGCTHYRKSNLRKSKFKGTEETKLYSRWAKVEAKLNELVRRHKLSASQRDEALEELQHLQHVLRLEAVHGREKSGECKAFSQNQDDFTLNFNDGLLSLSQAFDPALWAGLILTRLKEQGLYGKALKFARNEIDLLRSLIQDHGITPGTASQYCDIIFLGSSALKGLLPVSRIKREVEKKTGITFAAFAAATSQDFDPFKIVEDACKLLLKVEKTPDSADTGLIRFDDGLPDSPAGVFSPSGISSGLGILELSL